MSPLVGRFGTLRLSEVHIFPFRARRSLATMDQTRRSRPSARNWKTELALVAVILGLMICLAWNLTRTDAIAAAHSAYQRGELVQSLQFALDYSNRRPWSREAALVAVRCLSRLDYAEEAEPYFQRRAIGVERSANSSLRPCTQPLS